MFIHIIKFVIYIFNSAKRIMKPAMEELINPQTDKFPEIILNYSFTQLIKTPTQKLPITTNSIVTEK